MDDETVNGARRGDAFGWARIDHEAQVVEKCAKLGAVLLSPSAPQQGPTFFPDAPKPSSHPAGFDRRSS